jgi:ABC-type nitrate/sulfonate/bicarbonate transport system substrate-binding protein
MRTLRLGYFSASPVLALARAHGLFAERGLTIEAEAVTSSPAQFSSLHIGAYDVVLTSPDNVAAYRFGTNNALGVRVDVRIIRAVDGGMGLSLLGTHGVRRIDDLRGGAIAVDVPDSGFAFALYELLATHGLHRDVDYDVVAMGSTPRRAQALREGHCQATLLNGGLAVAATRDGFASLGRVSDVVRPYLGTVLAATGCWLDTHPVIVREFIEVWQQSVAMLLAANHDIDPLLADVFGLPVTHIPAIRKILHDPNEGLVPNGSVNPTALHNVLKLRAQHGPTVQTTPADGILDLR